MLHVSLNVYIDLLKLKTYKLFENSNADLSWVLFKEANLLPHVTNFLLATWNREVINR